MKKSKWFAAALAVTVGLIAVPAAAEEEVNITFVGIMQGGSAWGLAEQGFLDACEELGWNGQYVAPATANDLITMVDYTNTALTNGANALIGTFYDEDVFGDVLKEAHENGVAIAGTNCYISEECMDFWIGTDPVGMGETQAETLVGLVGESDCTVVYMQTNATSTTQNQQYDAFCEYLEDYENITVFGQEYCDSDSIKAAENISNLVKANPEINACVCADGYAAIGVGNYVEETGNADTFIALGIDDDADILNYISSGNLDCTIAQDFYKMGYEGCYMLKEVIDGNEISFANDSGTIVVKPEDVNSYAEEKGIEL